MVDIQDLVDRKVAERVGRDGDIWWAVVNLDSSTKTLRLYEVAEGDLPIADVSNYLRDDSVRGACDVDVCVVRRGLGAAGVAR